MSEATNTQPTANMTPYAAAKVVNAAFEEHGSDKRIPPQMMYNYTRARLNKGKNSFIEVDDKGLITPKGLQEWMQKYFKKHGIDLSTETPVVAKSRSRAKASATEAS